MTVFDRIRERSRLISLIIKFQNSAFYPFLFAMICAISGVSGKRVYLPCFFIMTVLSVFAGLFSHDLKVFIVPAFMFYYTFGVDLPEGHEKNWTFPPTFDLSSLYIIVPLGLIILAILFYRLFANGYIKETLSKRGIFFWGIIVFDAALILGGAFSSEFSLTSTLFGAMLAFVLTISYLLFTVIFSHSKNGVLYACKTLVACGYAVMFQIFAIAYKLYLDGHSIFNEFDIHGMRYMMHTSWGVATIIGAVLVPSIGAAMYLMASGRFPVLSLFSALFFFFGTIFIDTRSAIFMGAIVLVFGLIISCFRVRNKKINRVLLLLCVLGVISAALLLIYKFPDTYRGVINRILNILRINIDFESINEIKDFIPARWKYWRIGIDDFLSSPIFGKGFMYGVFSPEEANTNLFVNMYHNIFIQILASLGAVGFLMFVFHAKHICEVMLRKFSIEKLLILIIPISIIAMSFVDNFFFYPNFIIIYVGFLCAAEHLLEQRREQSLSDLRAPREKGKPRVVFTYVEAGKGHIVPTKTVCDVFTKKYGDRVDVIESRFFTETGDERMEKTERFFSRTVKQQNRSPIMSVLCKIGNVLAGDTLALFTMLRLTISGRKTNPLAVKHVAELDADVIYTAHWAIPFYVNQLKQNKPYTVCFCPDIYSNGAFNVDCNRFLIPSDVGYNQICRHRMYAGGNLTQVPFPMRPETEKYKSPKSREQYREKLGIAKDDFVAVLCDGGYGMARLGTTVKALLKSDVPLTVIAMCGTNKKLYAELSALESQAPKHIRLIAVDFTDKPLEYLVCADVFVGKSGANSIAEPASLGIPIIITKCATYIESGIKKYYVRRIKGALYIPSSGHAAKQIEKFAKNPALLKKYKNNLGNSELLLYDAEVSADIVFESVKILYPNI